MQSVIVTVTKQYRGYYEDGLLSKNEYLRFLEQLHKKAIQRNLEVYRAQQKLPQVIDGIHAMMQSTELPRTASIGEHIDRHNRLKAMAAAIKGTGGQVKEDYE